LILQGAHAPGAGVITCRFRSFSPPASSRPAPLQLVIHKAAQACQAHHRGDRVHLRTHRQALKRAKHNSGHAQNESLSAAAQACATKKTPASTTHAHFFNFELPQPAGARGRRIIFCPASKPASLGGLVRACSTCRLPAASRHTNASLHAFYIHMPRARAQAQCLQSSEHGPTYTRGRASCSPHPQSAHTSSLPLIFARVDARTAARTAAGPRLAADDGD
jgi:hypothetical protein